MTPDRSCDVLTGTAQGLLAQAAAAWADGETDVAQRLTAAAWTVLTGIAVLDLEAPLDPTLRRCPR